MTKITIPMQCPFCDNDVELDGHVEHEHGRPLSWFHVDHITCCTEANVNLYMDPIFQRRLNEIFDTDLIVRHRVDKILAMESVS